jgi:hypothetical protein
VTLVDAHPASSAVTNKQCDCDSTELHDGSFPSLKRRRENSDGQSATLDGDMDRSIRNASQAASPPHRFGGLCV